MAKSRNNFYFKGISQILVPILWVLKLDQSVKKRTKLNIIVK